MARGASRAHVTEKRKKKPQKKERKKNERKKEKPPEREREKEKRNFLQEMETNRRIVETEQKSDSIGFQLKKKRLEIKMAATPRAGGRKQKKVENKKNQQENKTTATFPLQRDPSTAAIKKYNKKINYLFTFISRNSKTRYTINNKVEKKSSNVISLRFSFIERRSKPSIKNDEENSVNSVNARRPWNWVIDEKT